jgi:pimeloyl-ACP methyl ester carboxylesterase
VPASGAVQREIFYRMKAVSRSVLVALLGLAFLSMGSAAEPKLPKSAIPYGDNAEAGKIAEINGIALYYEIYGAGPVMLVLHPNSGSIAAMEHQIAYFSRHYRVIAVDSRGHGKSGIGSEPLTYEQQADDINSLLNELQVAAVTVLGWSDGGILGLLLAIHYPDKVGKLAIMAANLNPEGAYPWALEALKDLEKTADGKIAEGDTTQPWSLYKRRFDLVAKQPQIPVADLAKIDVPVLVMAGDHDLIRLDHTLQIFQSLPKAHLAILPGSTHLVVVENPALFNRTVEAFVNQPFVRPDAMGALR